MDDITENVVCLIKVQTFFNQCAEKSQLDGWLKLTKNTYGVLCNNTKKSTPE